MIGGKGAAQKTGQGDGNLNGCQELGRAAGEPGQPQGALVPLGYQLRQLVVVDRDHRDLRAGKDGVKGD